MIIELIKLVEYYHNDPDSIDIKGHLGTLGEFSSKCESVTEFGFRHGASFSALLMGHPLKATTYDLEFRPQDIKRFMDLNLKTQLSFKKEDTTTCDIEETYFLFIDTLHTYSHLCKELERHHSKVKKYIGFHDTHTYRNIGEDQTTPGLMAAIELFMQAQPNWEIVYSTDECNGLLILEKK